MIYRLQRKFIVSSAAAVFLVIIAILILILFLNISIMNNTLDRLIDQVLASNEDISVSLRANRPIPKLWLNFMSSDISHSTSHFTVRFDAEGTVIGTNIESALALTAEEAIEYARDAIAEGKRGWVSIYHYKVYAIQNGTAVFFIDGSMNLLSLLQSMLIMSLVLFACAFVVLGLIVLFSKSFMKPVVESYEKQKQFITDANHELKTPLTLILTNLDIAEAELGKNEWLDDIRSEGHHMVELVNQLVEFSRMDEETLRLGENELNISEIVSDTVSEFTPLLRDKGKRLSSEIAPDIFCRGNEMLIRRLVSVLMDNAIKYCDENGEIRIRLQQRKWIVLTVENTYSAVDTVELDRLFDRFYRADKARTYAGSYGIGLAMAKEIVLKHRGEITAYKKDAEHIGFRVMIK